MPEDVDIDAWEKEFIKANPEPENNSDLDSDNDYETTADMLKSTKDDLMHNDKGISFNS